MKRFQIENIIVFFRSKLDSSHPIPPDRSMVNVTKKQTVSRTLPVNVDLTPPETPGLREEVVVVVFIEEAIAAAEAA